MWDLLNTLHAKQQEIADCAGLPFSIFQNDPLLNIQGGTTSCIRDYGISVRDDASFTRSFGGIPGLP